jgi:hypothetical protein
MSDPKPPPSMPASKTWTWRKEQARYQLRRVAYVGGGLAGLGLYGAGDMGANIFAEVQWLRAVFVVTALASAALLALAWEKCSRFIAEIERDHGEHMEDESTRELPNSVQNQLNNAIGLLLLTALVLVVAAVWSAITPDPT